MSSTKSGPAGKYGMAQLDHRGRWPTFGIRPQKLSGLVAEDEPDRAKILSISWRTILGAESGPSAGPEATE
jgi:hypothetical protein